MGLLLVGLVFILLIGAVVFALYKIFKNNKFIQKIGNFMYDKLVFNFFLRTFIAGYLVFCLGAFKNIKNLNFTTGVDGFSSVFAIL